MRWLIPAAVVAAIRLAAPAKANDRTQDEADQGSELARVPADQATPTAAPNSVRRMMQMLTRRDLDEQDRRRLTIPYGLLKSHLWFADKLLVSAASFPDHRVPVVRV